MKKGIILGVLGALIALLTACSFMCAYKPAEPKEEEDEQAQEESEFLGEAFSSIGMLTGALMFLLIFGFLAGVALVVWGAGKAAKNSQDLTFDEKARRFDKGLDLAIKTKQVIRK